MSMNKYNKFYKLNNKDSGESSKSKISKLRKILNKNKVNLQFISAPENIAWLLNLRGSDSEFSPIPNGYLILNNEKKIYFFCDLKKIDKKLKNDLQNITIINIKYIENFFLEIKNKSRIGNKEYGIKNFLAQTANIHIRPNRK